MSTRVPYSSLYRATQRLCQGLTPATTGRVATMALTMREVAETEGCTREHLQAAGFTLREIAEAGHVAVIVLEETGHAGAAIPAPWGPTDSAILRRTIAGRRPDLTLARAA